MTALQWLGHTRVILKNDGEPAIEALGKSAVEMAKLKLEDLDTPSRARALQPTTARRTEAQKLASGTSVESSGQRNCASSRG